MSRFMTAFYGCLFYAFVYLVQFLSVYLQFSKFSAPLLHFYLFDWLKNSDYEPIVRVLRHLENSTPSSLSGLFVKLWK